MAEMKHRRRGCRSRGGRRQGCEDAGRSARDETEGRRSSTATRAAYAPRSAELKAILEALIFASPEPLTPKAIVKLLDNEPKEDVQAALAELKQDYERPGGLQLVEVAGGYQIVDAAGSARVGAPAVPRAHDAEADGAGARDARGDRLPAAGHGARDHRDPRREHVRRAQHAARAASRSRSSAASRSSAGRSCTRRPRNS